MLNYKNFQPSKCKFVDISNVDDLANRQRILVELEDHSIVLFNINGEYFAIENECSHDGGPIGEGDLDGMKIICPRHGAQFDLATGKALALPAVEDIPAYPTRIVNHRIQVGIPKRSSKSTR